MNLKEKILACKDTKLKSVFVPEWDCEIFLKTWSGKERSTFQKAYNDHKDDIDLFYSLVVQASVCDENGKKLFNENDSDAIVDKNAIVLDRLVVEAMKHNSLDATAIRDAKKN